jgi:prepilin-type N-terminal cleavage/methylation domain-containing protein
VAARRRGFSLVEMLIVVVMIGIMLTIGFPKLRAGMVNNNVRAARTALINVIAGARSAASQTNRLTWMKVEGNRAVVLARPRLDLVNTGSTNADTIGPVHNLGQVYGVTITPTPDSVRFNSTLTSLGLAGKTFTITRSGRVETVAVDGQGRILK